MHAGTDPGMKDHISHMMRKTEVTLQHNDKPCGFEGLKIEKLMESISGTSRANARMIDRWVHKN
jgi:hypothetical protein